MSDNFKKGDVVWIRDYPYGRPLNLRGKIVGVLPEEHYNVLMENGLCEGQIKKIKFWKLLLDKSKNECYDII